MTVSNRSDSFSPVVSSHVDYLPKVMILGSSPGVISLEQQRYYAHPRNSFWWIMAQLFSFDFAGDYQYRLDKLSQSGVFLWDVLKRCERQGSLDVNILRQSEEVNDLESAVKKHATISMICFNGKAAHAIFKRHFNASDFDHIEFHVLPSTSPAHASMTREEKLQHWQVITDCLDNII